MVRRLWDRAVEIRDGSAVVSGRGRTVAEVIDRLESSAAPADVARDLGAAPRELVAILAFDALGSDQEDVGPPLVQHRPRRPGLERGLSEPALAEMFPTSPRNARLALAAGLLLIHDFWDASHHAAQEADDLGETAVSAYWHGIAHRREPDAGNASYWFRRVGRHPLFEPLGAAIHDALASDPAGPPVADRLAPRGVYDPFAFIAYCGLARGRDDALARRVQALEMALLLERSVPGSADRGT